MSHHITKIVVCASFLLSSLAFAATTPDVIQEVSNPNKTILVNQINKQFTITLASTPSTGYSWILESYNPNFIKLVEHEYVAPTKTMPGASGVENWTFETQLEDVAGPQLTEVHFINARMWEANKTAAKKADFTVVLY